MKGKLGTFKINVNINLSWSKIIAAVLLGLAFTVDMTADVKNGSVTMFAMPFVTLLITGKQVADIWKKPIITEDAK